jgi:hypothetical protein
MCRRIFVPPDFKLCRVTPNERFSHINKARPDSESRTVRRRTAALGIVFSPLLASAEPVDASLIALIASPREFDGKQVRIVGFLRLEFEGNAIYLHKEDYLRGITKNGLWMEMESASKKVPGPGDQYVIVEGTFSMQDQGHMGLWSGSIHKVTRVDPWRQP